MSFWLNVEFGTSFRFSKERIPERNRPFFRNEYDCVPKFGFKLNQLRSSLPKKSVWLKNVERRSYQRSFGNNWAALAQSLILDSSAHFRAHFWVLVKTKERNSRYFAFKNWQKLISTSSFRFFVIFLINSGYLSNFSRNLQRKIYKLS